ncbi:hypothetical protein O181_020871 [Austropuccinia psidii MF-1]|uniref:FHA domain-containing protein n=1 Tax=Austropuccinia psidii MF-1 TaxID=1389203 RepID=A0A9Q3C9W0_9BASI|nr:hypothetical protein [Austropuccinia psidii MF-1]
MFPINQTNFQANQHQIQSHHPGFPALHLHPVNDTFVPKQILLNPNGSRVKIGRQTSQKTVPNSTNGYFDSKVLSRMHAEVWTENGKVLIKDVKSSNGTFINGERLSPEGHESEAFELHTEDLVEFGIDIIADDNKSIVHHKVATKVFLVLNAEDAAAASNFYRSNGPDISLNRRTNRPGVFGGGGFDHVLNRLQTELEKSRATGQELNSLNSTINEIHDTLGGGTGPPPPLPPPYGGRIPPLAQQPHRQQQHLLQSQLAETQASLATYAEKMNALEAILAEHDQLKREVSELREQMESTRQRSDDLQNSREAEDKDMQGRASPVPALLELQEQQTLQPSVGTDSEIDTDSMSIISSDTVTWKPSSVKPQNQINGFSPQHSPSSSVDSKQLESLTEQNQFLTEKIELVSANLQDSMKAGQCLTDQYNQSKELIEELQQEIKGLKQQHLHQQDISKKLQTLEESVSQKLERQWLIWKEQSESDLKKQHENWQGERSDLLKMIKDLEEKVMERENTSKRIDVQPLDSPSSTTSTGNTTPNSSPSKSKKNKKKKSGNLSDFVTTTTSFQTSPSKSSTQPINHVRPASSTNSLHPTHTTSVPRARQQPEQINRLLEGNHSDSSDSTLRKGKSQVTQLATHHEAENEKKLDDDGYGSTHNSVSSNEKEMERNRKSFVFPYFHYISAASGVALLSLATYAFINNLKD